MNRTLLCLLALLCCSHCAQAELRTKDRGGCRIFYLRETAVQNNDGEAFCDSLVAQRFANGKSFQEVYDWVGPFLAYSFDQAERAACGTIGCATDRTQVTLFLLSNGMPNAGVNRAPGHMYLYMNTGLIDFIDAASRSFWADMVDLRAHRAPSHGYGKWMADMKAAGGKKCDWRLPFPTPTVSREDFPTIQTIAQSTYQVVFGHELAHYQSPSFACGTTQGSGLQLEMACDATSVRVLLAQRNSTMIPTGTVVSMMALKSYSRLARPTMFGIFGGAEQNVKVQEFIGVMDWQKRAVQVVDLWESYCKSGANSKICPQGYDDAVTFARNLTEREPPLVCRP